MHVCVCVCMCVRACMHACTYVCMYVCMYVRISSIVSIKCMFFSNNNNSLNKLTKPGPSLTITINFCVNNNFGRTLLLLRWDNTQYIDSIPY